MAANYHKEKTHVSRFVKYTMFFFNFFIMLIGSFVIGIGGYAIHAGYVIEYSYAKLSYLKIFAIRNLEQICCTLFLLQHRGEFDKFMSGEMKFDEITDIIHRVPLLVVITGVIIFIISFAGNLFLAFIDNIIGCRKLMSTLHVLRYVLLSKNM